MGKFFGTDGIRGKAEMFTPEFIGKFAAGLVTYAGDARPSKNGERPLRVLLGGDTRESGEWILSDLEQALESLGIDHGNVGVLPTPAINYAFYEMGYDMAIDVTASHNPYTDNGLKVFERSASAGHGVKLCAEGVAQVEYTLENGVSLPVAGVELREDLHGEAVERYMEHLEESIGGAELSGMRIGLDCANGATSVIAGKVFEKLGAEVVVINADADYGTGINDGAGSTHPEKLQELVVAEKLDFGAAFDGDGDRCMLVDAAGELVDGDQTIALIADALNLTSVAVTVMTNQGLFEWAEGAGVKVEVTDVGDQNVYAAMAAKGIPIGGEQSGHVILPGEAMGDGMLTALTVAKIMATSGRTLRELAAVMPRYPQVNTTVPADAEQKKMILEITSTRDTLEAVKQAFRVPRGGRPSLRSRAEVISKIIARCERTLAQEGGRLLVRPSGTEDVVRVTLWGKDEEKLNKLAEELVEKLKEAL